MQLEFKVLDDYLKECDNRTNHVRAIVNQFWNKTYDNIIDVIGSIAFSITASIWMGAFIKYKSDKRYKFDGSNKI